MPTGKYPRGKPNFRDGKHENKRDGNYNIRVVFPKGEHWRSTFIALKSAAEAEGVSIPYMIRAVLHLHFIQRGKHKSYSECPRCVGAKVVEMACPKCDGEGKIAFDPMLDGKIEKVARGKPKPAAKRKTRR